MTNEYVLRRQVTRMDAHAIVHRNLPDAAPECTELRHHPFVGFVHAVNHRMVTAEVSPLIHTLVDRFTGRPYLSDPWPGLTNRVDSMGLNEPTDPEWNAVSLNQARHNATRLIRTSLVRRLKLAHGHSLHEKQCLETVWKPNWVITASYRRRPLQVLVDALTGGYYILGT